MRKTERKPVPEEEKQQEQLPTLDEFKNAVGAIMRASREQHRQKKQKIKDKAK